MIDMNWLKSNFPEIVSADRLGQGGQKEVFAGSHATDGEVVLKIFHLGADRERVLREIRAAQDVPSARVPTIFESGTKDSPLGEVVWVREQRITGHTLREVLQRGILADKEILLLGLHIAEALAAAERVRIVHRDVKPDNIIAADAGGYWLLDFGFSRHLDLKSVTETARHFGVGTPGYAPPEQLFNRKSEIDSRADLFGLGMTLYESIEGENPLRAGARDIGEVVGRTATQLMPPIQRQVDSINEMQGLVQAMTRIQRDHRPVTALAAYEWMKEICVRDGVK